MRYIILFLLLILFCGCGDNNTNSITLNHKGIGSGAYHHKSDSPNIIYTIKEKPATIYKLKLSHDKYKVLETITIKQSNTIDAEALVKLSNGTFWIGDEKKPSLIHVDKDGTILKRVISKKWNKAKKNRGFESLAISKDENFLYTILQSPQKGRSKTLTIFKYDIKKDKLTKSRKYKLDNKKNYINEMVYIKKDTLVLLENQKDGYIFYKINLKEKSNKKAVFHFNRLKKIEGMAYLGDNKWILINDDDSQRDGLKGAMTRVSF